MGPGRAPPGRPSRPDGAGALRAPQTREAILPLLAETFREHGYEGASLSAISRRTGLGKGSLYHFFPGGKEEMAACVLTEIEAWFEARMFRPLREDPDPAAALRAMLAETDGYFRSGRRVCLVGAFALSTTRDAFARRIDAYFAAWRDAVAAALARGGVAEACALDLAEETVTAIQGALVTASALQDPGLFGRTLDRLATRLAAALGEGAGRPAAGAERASGRAPPP